MFENVGRSLKLFARILLILCLIGVLAVAILASLSAHGLEFEALTFCLILFVGSLASVLLCLLLSCLGELTENSAATRQAAEELDRGVKSCALLLRNVETQCAAINATLARQEYWDVHTGEKEQLAAQLQQVEREIERVRIQGRPYRDALELALQKQQESVSAEKERDVMQKRRTRLMQKRDSLGLTDNSRKRALQEKIDQYEVDMWEMGDLIDEQRAALQEETGAEIDALLTQLRPLSEELRALKARKSAIEAELKGQKDV